jgi:sugar phosphate isomerase/epimerase
MKRTRKEFIQLSSSFAAALALGKLTTLSSCSNSAEAATTQTFGLQLYTLRDVLPQDPKGILKQVASFGYKQIESYEGPQGMFWGMGHTGFKKYMDELGMTIIASHCDIGKDFEQKAAEAAAIGMKYLICPWKGPQKTLDDFKKFADEFNQKGEICKKNGIRFAYHNHAYSFNLLEGQYPQDVMMKNTDPATVDYEMDMYWVVTGKQDPIEWLKKYPNRFRLCHVKDRIKGATEEGASCTLGEGSIDYSKILTESKNYGMQYFVVEQERYDGTTPMKAAEADAAYMKNLKV